MHELWLAVYRLLLSGYCALPPTSLFVLTLNEKECRQAHYFYFYMNPWGAL